jgi:hypothetical protein
MDATDLHHVHWTDPEGDVEETDVASPGSCDTFQLDADVAWVYLSVIRERKEREWALLKLKIPLDSACLDNRPPANMFRCP